MMAAALRAEWAKARTVPDLAAYLVAAVVLTVAAGAAGVGLLGVHLGQAVVAVAGVQLLAGEHGTGLIRPTLLAVPRRVTVLAAKAVLLTAGTAVAATASLLVAHPPLDGAAVRAATGSVLHLCLIALLSLGAGALLRSATAAAGVVLGLLYAVPLLAIWLPDPDWIRTLHRIAPSTAGLTIQSTADAAALPMVPWPGLAVTAAWTAVSLAAGAYALTRRDVTV
ncbi:ABC transporter permease [Actinoplanes sp. URMC 104]|uniref:ABC transporter permease n=1 Tax=Actinoplanes sp. URMC 104 TaxID=3423409 RepID=UPI003F1D7505